MSSRMKNIALRENSPDREMSMYSEKSLSLLQSSMSSTDPGYVDVDLSITSMSCQKVANSVQENSPIMLHNGTTDVGMSVCYESDKDDDIRDPNYQLEESSEETSEDDLVQCNLRERKQKLHYKKITNKNKELKITWPRILWNKEEKKLVEDKAKIYFETFKPPTMKFCTSLAKEPVLKRRNVTTVKAYIMNEIKRRKLDVHILNPRTKCNRGVKKFWTEQEKEKVLEIFQENLQSKKLPSLAVCRKVISEHKIFADRTPAMLKTCISNILKKNDFMPV